MSYLTHRKKLCQVRERAENRGGRSGFSGIWPAASGQAGLKVLRTNDTAGTCITAGGGAPAPIRQHLLQSVQEACEWPDDFAADGTNFAGFPAGESVAGGCDG